jgi:hypothetical protein
VAAQKRDGKPEAARGAAVEALRALCKGVREVKTVAAQEHRTEDGF